MHTFQSSTTQNLLIFSKELHELAKVQNAMKNHKEAKEPCEEALQVLSGITENTKADEYTASILVRRNFKINCLK